MKKAKNPTTSKITVAEGIATKRATQPFLLLNHERRCAQPLVPSCPLDKVRMDWLMCKKATMVRSKDDKFTLNLYTC